MKFIALILCVAGAAHAREILPALIRKVQPYVVTVRSYDRAGALLIQGSGFFLGGSRILTSRHVLDGAVRADITTGDGRVYAIKTVLAEDALADILVVEAPGSGGARRLLKVRAKVPQVGERVLVVGSPLGLHETVSDGIVSAVREISSVGTVLQITAPISAGSSGSPVFNMKGEVIGVARSQRQDGQNLNFAVPAGRVLALDAE